MFLEKPHTLHPPPQSSINLPVGIRESISFKKPFLQKRKKRTLITFLEKPHLLHPPPQSLINLPVGIRKSISSKKPFLQKRKKRTLITFLEKPTPFTHYPKTQLTYQ